MEKTHEEKIIQIEHQRQMEKEHKRKIQEENRLGATPIDHANEFAHSVSKEMINLFSPEQRRDILEIIKYQLSDNLSARIYELENIIKMDTDYLNILKEISY